jgi:hypothetical protein
MIQTADVVGVVRPDLDDLDAHRAAEWAATDNGNSHPRNKEKTMQITYDTVTDRIASPDLTEAQTRQLQAELVAALGRNDPVRTVAQQLLRTAQSLG